MFIGKLFEHRPSYHLLGVLLFVQLGITSASWAVQRLTQATNIVGKDAQQLQSQAIPSSREQKAVVLEVVCTTINCQSIQLLRAYESIPCFIALALQSNTIPA